MEKNDHIMVPTKLKHSTNKRISAMKDALIYLGLAIIGLASSPSQAIGSEDLPHLRHLDEDVDTTCVGESLGVGAAILPNQSICTTLTTGEKVFFGIFTSTMPDDLDYTMYRIEIRSSRGTYNRQYSGRGTRNDLPGPDLKLQGDGNLVFGGSGFSLCIVQPGLHPNELAFNEEDGISLQISDNQGNIIWDSHRRSACYPDIRDRCFSVLEINQRLTWKEFLCTFNEDGSIAYKFGLNRDMGVLGLWKGSSLIWRPTSRSGGWARGDYLHFQNDGHLTLYKDTQPKKTYIWTSDDCIDFTAEKLTLTSDGDVLELNSFGTIVWSLHGSEIKTLEDLSAVVVDPRDSLTQECRPKSYCVVPPSTPLFEIAQDVDIGDTLDRPGPAFLKSCGPRCYDMKDNGDDPPYDPEYGDTMRFAYREVDYEHFRFRAKACVTHCKDTPWKDVEDFYAADFGSIGLMVRESLDPLSKKLFVSHRPFYAVDWSYRSEQGADHIESLNGSQDVECLWITLERKSKDEFHFYYQYISYTDEECGIGEWQMEENTIQLNDMSEKILVGLGISSHIPDEWYQCPHTQARFSEIEFVPL
jgi:hypothetical protein